MPSQTTYGVSIVSIWRKLIVLLQQSSRMDFMVRLPNCTDKHQMLIILTNPTSDIWILRLTKQTCWRDFGKTVAKKNLTHCWFFVFCFLFRLWPMRMWHRRNWAGPRPIPHYLVSAGRWLCQWLSARQQILQSCTKPSMCCHGAWACQRVVVIFL